MALKNLWRVRKKRNFSLGTLSR